MAVLHAGCLLLAFGPPAALALTMLSYRHLCIVLIVSCFFSLSGQLVAACVWAAVIPLRSSRAFNIVSRVVGAELARYVLFRTYREAEAGFSVTTLRGKHFPMRDMASSITAGLGFGATSTAVVMAPVLRHSVGPAALSSDRCETIPAFALISATALSEQIVALPLMLLGFDAYRRGSVAQVAAVAALHLASSLSVLSNAAHEGCRAALAAHWSITVIACASAVLVTRRLDYRSPIRWSST